MPSELQEALTAASAVTPLIQKQIDPLLLEYQRRYSPLLRALPAKQWGSTQYFFNRRVNRPDAGGVLDGGGRPIGNSVYEQAVFNIRLYQAVGSVTGFAQTVTRDLVGDLRQLEIDGTMQSMLWTVENAFVWGHDGATAAGQYPISTGLDYLVGNFAMGTGSNAFVNALQYTSGTNSSFNGATLALKYLDEIMDLVETNAGMPVGSDWMFVMSPRMASSVGQLLLNQQRFMDKVEVAAGLNVPTYRDVPIIKSSFLSPRSTVMSTVSATPSSSGGSLASATYNYAVSAVVARFGETAVATVSSGAVTGPNGSVSLAFSTPTGLPDNATPILYKVYRSTGTNIPQLIGVVDAYDTTGTATTTIVDTGTNLLTNSGGNTGPSGYQGVGAGGVINGTGTTAYLPRPAGTSPVEDIYLIPRDPNFLVRPYTRDMQVIPLAPTVSAPDTLPFALVSDTTLAVRGPKYVGRGSGLVSSI